ncbi:hypothetical protein HUW46_09287 [Amycolatopsis sp. CA-230715]|nr:hypothetical protein HUW46_09287 [Amycolatopsis sp. CA-230715]
MGAGGHRWMCGVVHGRCGSPVTTSPALRTPGRGQTAPRDTGTGHDLTIGPVVEPRAPRQARGRSRTHPGVPLAHPCRGSAGSSASRRVWMAVLSTLSPWNSSRLDAANRRGVGDVLGPRHMCGPPRGGRAASRFLDATRPAPEWFPRNPAARGGHAETRKRCPGPRGRDRLRHPRCMGDDPALGVRALPLPARQRVPACRAPGVRDTQLTGPVVLRRGQLRTEARQAQRPPRTHPPHRGCGSGGAGEQPSRSTRSGVPVPTPRHITPAHTAGLDGSRSLGRDLPPLDEVPDPGPISRRVDDARTTRLPCTADPPMSVRQGLPR